MRQARTATKQTLDVLVDFENFDFPQDDRVLVKRMSYCEGKRVKYQSKVANVKLGLQFQEKDSL